MRIIEEYQTAAGRAPFRKWLLKLDEQTRHRVRARLDMLRVGHDGDRKYIGDGISEIRLHFGPGYRIYFGEVGTIIVILLCAGDKKSQNRDIEQAKVFWQDYLRRANS